MHVNFGYNYFWKSIMHYNIQVFYKHLYNALSMKASCINCYQDFIFLHFFFQIQNESTVINTQQVATVTFTNPFSIAVSGELSVACPGLQEKAQTRYTKCFKSFMSIHNIIIQVNDCYETGFSKHAHIINTCIIWDKPLEMPCF